MIDRAPIGQEAVLTPVSVPSPRHVLSAWRGRFETAGVPAVVAVAGSRGKTTVTRLLDAILRDAGLRTALWTDRGVEIEGRLQRGELAPWSRALAGLGEDRLDVAAQELDWNTVHAVGLPKGVYPVVAITNLCVNNDSCLIHEETVRARRALRALREAVHEDGLLVLNGDDFAVAGDDPGGKPDRFLYGLSRDTPLIRRHLRFRGRAAWSEAGRLWVGGDEAAEPIVALADLNLALGGLASFQVMNALAAVSIAYSVGVPADTIERALKRYTPEPEAAPGSFNVMAIGGATVVVDRPAHPWFLRPALRALSQLPGERLVRVVGRLNGVADEDLVETGRLLGRGGGAILLHTEGIDPARSSLLRQGISANDVPPIVLRSPGERAALTHLLRTIRRGDLVFVLADRPLQVVRTLVRAGARPLAPAPPLGADVPAAVS